MAEPTPGILDPRTLVDTRLQLHHAAQLVAALGNSLLPPVPDFSHTALGWDGDTKLQSPVLQSSTPCRVELAFSQATPDGYLTTLEVKPVPSNGEPSVIAAVNGATFADLLAILQHEVDEYGGDGSKLQPPAYQPGEFPDHAVAHDQPFSINPEQAAELALYYTLANDLLQAVAADPQASPVRIWPHHFDIATLISLDEDGGEQARTIGAGMSPGDSGYDQPYFYVTPWPYPPTDRLPALQHGSWHTEGWTGAVLTGSDLRSAGPNVRQTASDFLIAAVAACRDLLAC